MVLHTNKERMLRNFYDLYKGCIRIDTAGYHTITLKKLQVVIIKFITVTVAFGNTVFTINPFSQRAFFQLAGISTKPHSTTHHFNLLLLFHHVNYWVLSSYIH